MVRMLPVCCACLVAAVTAAAQPNDEQKRAPLAAPARRDALSDKPRPQDALRKELSELIERKLAAIEQQIQRAETLLAEGARSDAGIALQEARLQTEETRAALRWIESISSRWQETAESVSVVEIRVVRERRKMERISERAPPVARAWALTVDGVFFRDLPQDIEAEVIATHMVGRRFADGTLMGRLRPLQQRRDLQPGRTIELRQVPRATGIMRLEEGRNYWVAITPPLAEDSAPRLVGTGRRAHIALAVRTEPTEAPGASSPRP